MPLQHQVNQSLTVPISVGTPRRFTTGLQAFLPTTSKSAIAVTLSFPSGMAMFVACRRRTVFVWSTLRLAAIVLECAKTAIWGFLRFHSAWDRNLIPKFSCSRLSDVSRSSRGTARSQSFKPEPLAASSLDSTLLHRTATSNHLVV